MDTSAFDYELPPEAIAQEPAPQRDAARLLLVDRTTARLSHHRVSDLPHLLPGRMDFIRNNARVLRARLHGHRPGGGSVECLLLRPAENFNDWWCLLRPGRRLPPGSTFTLPGNATAEVIEKSPHGECRVRFLIPGEGSVTGFAEQTGEMPLPPYIRRDGQDPRKLIDNERYDTVYASAEKTVAAAAPTAGLHFTPALITTLRDRGHRFHDITLHVGLDTFRPVQTATIEAHTMHAETYEIPAGTTRILTVPERPRLAVGTTSLRASEDYLRKQAGPLEGRSEPFVGEAKLFIYPPSLFGIEALMTNFHLPRSTLLCLVSAFLTPGSADGVQWFKEIYAEALRHDYRFYSYGDAMLIL